MIVKAKNAVLSKESVFQLFALYRSFAFTPVIPDPWPIPLTVTFESTVCPVVYGLEVFGLVPVIGLLNTTAPMDWNTPTERRAAAKQ